VQRSRNKAKDTVRAHAREAFSLALLVLTASCVPAAASQKTLRAQELASAPAVPLQVEAAMLASLEPTALQPVAPTEAAAMNAAIPLAETPNPRAASFVVRGRTAIDQMRSQDCLAQAVYYEARSESEDGQRAVAQVVLNRVRHPAYPNSVCGVVYQGPMRAGGGCQFTFTCDGSLARAPSGFGWFRARRIAADALAGQVFAPVGHATHYHADFVFPRWATILLKSAVIGRHIFYRLEGGWGTPSAFRSRYAGVEPAPRPYVPAPATPILPISAGVFTEQLAYPIGAMGTAATRADTLPKVQFADDSLPHSQVREEYRNSGAWRVDPAKAFAAARAEATTGN
jgi:spore germination cell wall hydrolase CwlJ-like protein